MEVTSKKEDKASAIKFEALEGENVLGHAYLYLIFNDLHEKPYGLLENVFVKEEARGKGTGTKLVETVISEAKKQGCYKLIGTSRYANERVHTLYEKIGFKDHGKEFRMNLI